MPRKALLCALALLLSYGLAGAQSAPEIRQFDISTLEKLGREIYEQDQAAWHATDALHAVHPIAELRQEKVIGWVVTPTPEGPLVRFVREGASGLEAAYDIHDPNGKPRLSVPQDRNLTEEQKIFLAVRSVAISTIGEPCGDNFNLVVLKDPQSDGWLAWILAATTNPDLIMLGGHRRLTISADGTKLLRNDALSRSCFVMEKGKETPDRKLAALASVQLVSNIPVETFVFLSLQHRLPLIVITPDKVVWGIENGGIRAVSTLDK